MEMFVRNHKEMDYETSSFVKSREKERRGGTDVSNA